MSFFSATIRRIPFQSLRLPVTRLSVLRNMHIQSIPMCMSTLMEGRHLRADRHVGEGSGNNYAYLVSDDKTREAVIIDPAHAEEVLPVLEKETQAGLKLTKIINTHHHHDHAGGNKEILKHHKLPIVGGRDCALVNKTPTHKETFNIGSIEVTALHTPCHTQDSICFYFKDGDDKAVFTGDTMFIGGCGRFFEGTAEEMHKALNQTLAALPDDTKVFPGHEYTKGNVKFAKTVAKDNEAVKKLDAYSQANKETQGKFTIGDEKKHNVFMLYADPEIQKAVGQTEPVEVVRTLRALKDRSDTADRQVAELKSTQASFYSPQIYFYRSTGTFATMYGEERRKHSVLTYGKTALDVIFEEWRERFWPTTKALRKELEAEAAVIKAKESRENRTGWRLKTWPVRMGQRVCRHVMHFLQHGSFAEKRVVPRASPFAKLDDMSFQEILERRAREL
ncbi:hypothetical protein OPT61_g3497 [Boeremia exigua]|uniref:Uncharacterized protein n=1 Tax=Boeremia exigua TaxID=749465 RepID=A0ACC2IHN6_9PLEO|nr:hypothetical protein OPT61_g3497 [Boeremia exigua]